MDSHGFHVDFPLKELMFALRGVPGDIFHVCGDNELVSDALPIEYRFDKFSSVVKAYFHPAELDMCDKILAVASKYMSISGYLETNAIR